MIKFLNRSNFSPLKRKCSSKGLKRGYKTVKDMPGPREFPFIGTSWTYSILGPYKKTESITTAREDLLSKYGPIYKERLGGSFIVNLHEPAHIETVMRNQGIHPMRVLNEANVKWRRSRPDLYKSIGLVDSHGEEWYDIRMKASPTLLKAGQLTGFTEIFSTIADDFIANIRRDVFREQDLDVRDYIYRYALEAIWNASLGFKLGTFEEHKTEVAKRLISLSMALFHAFAKLSISRPWFKLWKTPTYRDFCNSEEEMFRIVNEYNQDIMKEFGRDIKLTLDNKTSLIVRFLANTEFDKSDVNTVIIDFIAAGIPTTSYFLSLLLHRLGQEQEIQNRLHKELDSLNLKKGDIVNDEILSRLPFLAAILKEGFRLTTIIPGIARLLPQDIQIDDYEIPALTPIMSHTRAAALSETYFTKPLEFIPDRWLKSNSSDSAYNRDISQLQEEAKRNRFLMMPFGFGGRMCIGRKLAEAEMSVLLAKIFLNFKLESEGTLELENYFIIGPKSSVRIKFIER